MTSILLFHRLFAFFLEKNALWRHHSFSLPRTLILQQSLYLLIFLVAGVKWSQRQVRDVLGLDLLSFDLGGLHFLELGLQVSGSKGTWLLAHADQIHKRVRSLPNLP